MKYCELPLSAEAISQMKAGEKIMVTGTLYTARDAAHKRLVETLQSGALLPVNLEGQAIYYVGPAPAKAGDVIGPAGPTTSGRMDAFAPKLLDQGLKIMIGKGRRDAGVIEAIKRNKAVYLAAVGGAAAIMMDCIKSAKVIAYDDLGTEAIRELYVENMPLIVAVDSRGNDYYDIGPACYLNQNIFGREAL